MDKNDDPTRKTHKKLSHKKKQCAQKGMDHITHTKHKHNISKYMRTKSDAKEWKFEKHWHTRAHFLAMPNSDKPNLWQCPMQCQVGGQTDSEGGNQTAITRSLPSSSIEWQAQQTLGSNTFPPPPLVCDAHVRITSYFMYSIILTLLLILLHHVPIVKLFTSTFMFLQHLLTEYHPVSSKIVLCSVLATPQYHKASQAISMMLHYHQYWADTGQTPSRFWNPWFLSCYWLFLTAAPGQVITLMAQIFTINTTNNFYLW